MDAFRSLVKSKAKDKYDSETNEKESDLVKLPSGAAFQKSLLDRFKSSVKI